MTTKLLINFGLLLKWQRRTTRTWPPCDAGRNQPRSGTLLHFFLVMNWDRINWYNFVCPCVQDATEPASTMQVVINGTRCLFIRWNGLQLPAWDENALNSTELQALGPRKIHFGFLESQHSQTFVKLGKPTEFRASEHRISAEVERRSVTSLVPISSTR